MKRTLLFSAAFVLFMLLAPAQAHRSGCHRWHSCPSDTGSYVCGDLGYTSGCQANGRVQPAAAPVLSAAPPAPGGGTTRHTTTSLNLRAGPSAQSAKVATLPSGTAVRLVSCSSGWCRVQWNGRGGYVSQTHLR
ncbi:SH3 domain-containing protein [Deinococcus aetherius]|nr:SH3 domain-containing protein [Deinococcus aetherius]